MSLLNNLEQYEDVHDVFDDFVLLDTGDVLTSGSQWDKIVFHMLKGRKIYHRYSEEYRDMDESGWQRKGLEFYLPANKRPLLTMGELEKGEFYDSLNKLETPADEGYNPENIYYCVWYLKPLNNLSAVSFLNKDTLIDNWTRRFLNEERVVATDMGKDIGVD